MDSAMTTTAFTLDGYRVVKSFGVVRGIIVRSRSIFGTIGAGLQTLVGGNISLFSDLCEQTRRDAMDRMLEHARSLGANAVIGLRYDATEIMQGLRKSFVMERPSLWSRLRSLDAILRISLSLSTARHP
jgi:uncharacterized protein YbjQ (UPF0145 family)